ncbi:MAG: acetyltransferase [Rhodocyclaceae bacterium]|nr:acetyltransferase [Rhodocyclaceae bacterium]MDZ4215941.1 acetyltransferase [Rhodocyclaceae bacterium]
MSDFTRYVLWGSAGHAKVLAEIIALHGGRVVALFDNNQVPSALADVPIFLGEAGFGRWADAAGDLYGVLGLAAIGGQRGRDRLAIHQLFRSRGIDIPRLIHPTAVVSDSAQIGAGCQVLAQANVAADARLGEACILNHRASVDHECTLGDAVHLAPGATLCGCITVANNVFVGANAVVLPRLSIGADAVIGAGAVVTRDVPANTIVVGNPARPTQRN